MIKYDARGAGSLLNIFRVVGSVWPKVLPVSLLCGLLAAGLKFMGRPEVHGKELWDAIAHNAILEGTVWTGFSSLLGFLVIFRTNQAYSRYWEGCVATFRMRAEWFDAAASCAAFTKYARLDEREKDSFLNVLIRLFSMLHAAALAEIEDSNVKNVMEVEAFRYNLIDASSINEDTLVAIRESPAKVEMIFQWIQQLFVENMDGVLSISAPILTRSFQELANGMVAFSDAIRISTCPFPFPYAQLCDILLLIHRLITPVVIGQWVASPLCAGLVTCMTIFTFAGLNSIALEIENPFGADQNDIDCPALQHEFNVLMIQMISARQKSTPFLNQGAALYGQTGSSRQATTMTSFVDAWAAIPGLVPKRRSMRTSPSAESLGEKKRERPASLFSTMSWMSGSSRGPTRRSATSARSTTIYDNAQIYDDVGEQVRRNTSLTPPSMTSSFPTSSFPTAPMLLLERDRGILYEDQAAERTTGSNGSLERAVQAERTTWSNGSLEPRKDQTNAFSDVLAVRAERTTGSNGSLEPGEDQVSVTTSRVSFEMDAQTSRLGSNGSLEPREDAARHPGMHPSQVQRGRSLPRLAPALRVPQGVGALADESSACGAAGGQAGGQAPFPSATTSSHARLEYAASEEQLTGVGGARPVASVEDAFYGSQPVDI